MDMACPVGSIPYIIRRRRLLSPGFLLDSVPAGFLQKTGTALFVNGSCICRSFADRLQNGYGVSDSGAFKKYFTGEQASGRRSFFISQGFRLISRSFRSQKKAIFGLFSKKNFHFSGGGKDCRRWSRILSEVLRFFGPFPLRLEKYRFQRFRKKAFYHF